MTINPKKGSIMKTYHQGDINFVPLAALGKHATDVKRDGPLRATSRRLLIQEGEITGHHHGIWFDGDVVDRTAERDDLSSAKATVDALMEKLTAGELAPARLYQDDALTKTLNLDAGAPVIGYLICDEQVTIRHASESGVPTGEHADIQLPAGGYLVTGKREWTAGDQRRVAD